MTIESFIYVFAATFSPFTSGSQMQAQVRTEQHGKHHSHNEAQHQGHETRCVQQAVEADSGAWILQRKRAYTLCTRRIVPRTHTVELQPE
jgi:hypothetical protein